MYVRVYIYIYIQIYAHIGIEESAAEGAGSESFGRSTAAPGPYIQSSGHPLRREKMKHSLLFNLGCFGVRCRAENCPHVEEGTLPR